MAMIRRLQWKLTPQGLTSTQRKNLTYTQLDALGVGIVNGIAAFLAVFLTRLGATDFEVGLLSSLSGFTGLFLAFVAGRFLERQRNVVPWYSGARLVVTSAYVLTGLVSLVLPEKATIIAVLIIWALASFPQTLQNVAFNVTMNSIAGPQGRYIFMSRRWSVLGLVSAMATAAASQILERLNFPTNYQIVFIVFSLGGLISFNFSRRFVLPDRPPQPRDAGTPLWLQLKKGVQLVLRERPFVAFAGRRLVYTLGSFLVGPLFTLYYVRQLEASDAWIGAITMIQQAVLLIGYQLWIRLRARWGSRFVLLGTTLALALYPILVALTRHVGLVVVYAAVAGVFQAGLNLVFFDELMKRVPHESSPTFIAIDQTAQNLLSMTGPLISTALSAHIGIAAMLIVSGGVRLLGFGLFLLAGSRPGSQSALAVNPQSE